MNAAAMKGGRAMLMYSSANPVTGNIPVSVYVIVIVIAAALIAAAVVAGIVSKKKKK